MDWMQFVSAMTASLAWPASVIGLAILLKPALAGLIPKIRSFKYKDFHIDLVEKLDALKDEVSASGSVSRPESQSSASPNVVELAAIDPRAAIISSWQEVETELSKLAAKHNLPPAQFSVSNANLLHAQNILDKLTFMTFVKLHAINRDIAHVRPTSIDFAEAVAMANMCQWLVNQLRIANSIS